VVKLREDGVLELALRDREWPERVSDGLVSHCKICRRKSNIDYRVDDAIWRLIVPPKHLRGFVCLDCFAELAERQGIKDWPRYLQEIQICGKSATAVARVYAVILMPT